MHLYDTLSRETKPFPPEHEGPVTIYACGPTVYHYAHIGNLRTFLTVDLLRRYLEYRGRDVRLVMNITDVGHMLNDAERGEDKMEAAAKREGKTQEDIARFYEEAYFRDMDALGVKRAWKNPRATEHIDEMTALVTTLLDKGLAYATEKGDIYYDVSKFGAYGELSGNTVAELEAGARVEVAEDKRHPADFALWIRNDAHQMQWEFAWGGRVFKGYPGWHLECSAMAEKYLGETIDLHVGGEDLKFPHHECEIAQSEGASGKPFARHWLHVTYLLVDGEKMSKSKGNFYTLQDLLDKGYCAAAIRWLLLSAHYRTQLNFTLEGLDAAEKAIGYFREVMARLRAAAGTAIGPSDIPSVKSLIEALDDDLNVSKALAIVHDAAKESNRALDAGDMSPQAAAGAYEFLDSALNGIFGIDLDAASEEAPEDVRRLAGERQTAREGKDWAESDRLRDLIAAKGWVVEDTPQGPKLKKA